MIVQGAGMGLSSHQATEHPILAAVEWIEGVLVGPVATGIAVIAIASVGLLMLSGRVNVRRGAAVIIGCFIVFGAAAIAEGLQGTARAMPRETTPLPSSADSLPDLQVGLIPPPPTEDPYAGAAVRR